MRQLLDKIQVLSAIAEAMHTTLQTGGKILFCGNGSKKWQHLCLEYNAEFADVALNVADLAESASKKFNNRAFSDLAYTEPAYLKNAYTGKSK